MAMLAMHSVIANSTITMAELSVHMTRIMTATLLVTVPVTMVQDGGLIPVWPLTSMDATTTGITAASRMASTGAPGISWLTIAQGKDTHLRVLKWKWDQGGAKNFSFLNEMLTCNHTPAINNYFLSINNSFQIFPFLCHFITWTCQYIELEIFRYTNTFINIYFKINVKCQILSSLLFSV